jgi:hypothetical protein
MGHQYFQLLIDDPVRNLCLRNLFPARGIIRRSRGWVMYCWDPFCENNGHDHVMYHNAWYWAPLVVPIW